MVHGRVAWLKATGSLVVLLVLVGCGAQGSGAATGTQSGSGADDAQFVQTKCTLCHSYDRVAAASYDAAKWTETVTRMQQNGLVVTDAEKSRIIEFLAAQ
ncbi:MAG: hypothetical protein CVT67_10545 [Actinobacteria bacterium HGW-Actinobacteria-7]|jgi:hypothetical protein|nr:MAG: hypothetical protein CVT67_10545 [Actinobacteria bacterium HGW-Actinobacteria-7]